MAEHLLDGITHVLEVLCSIVLAAMMLLTFVDVIGRYVFGAPIFGASEMISTMLALTIFLGLGIANARDKHIVVELIDKKVRAVAPKTYDIVVQGFSIAAMCLIVFVLYQQTVETAHSGAKTIVLEWPIAWISGAVTVLAALSVACQVLGLVVPRGSPPEHHLEDV